MTIHSVISRITRKPSPSPTAPLADDPWSCIMRGEGTVIHGTCPEARHYGRT